MTDTSKSLALELADELERAAKFPAYPKANYAGAAAELRRLAAVESELAALKEALRGLEPVAWMDAAVLERMKEHCKYPDDSLWAVRGGISDWTPDSVKENLTALYTLPPNLKG